MTCIFLRLKLWWAELAGDDLAALAILETLLMADFTALNAAADRVAAKAVADAAALAAVQAQLDAANAAAADVQTSVDAVTAKLDAVAPGV